MLNPEDEEEEPRIVRIMKSQFVFRVKERIKLSHFIERIATEDVCINKLSHIKLNDNECPTTTDTAI
jgi:hypothetical protein|tara:strand:- start:163 stop:363 length:201 start_codon:yes stop_codon:yes gene_type:complete